MASWSYFKVTVTTLRSAWMSPNSHTTFPHSIHSPILLDKSFLNSLLHLSPHSQMITWVPISLRKWKQSIEHCHNHPQPTVATIGLVSPLPSCYRAWDVHYCSWLRPTPLPRCWILDSMPSCLLKETAISNFLFSLLHQHILSLY